MTAIVFDRVSKRFAPLPGRPWQRRDRPAAVLALDELSFEVREGEALAIIGVNGAGKTTALRLAARLSAPTSGRVRVEGRVASLIAVGAGLHPELTGRENVALYARILGIRGSALRRRLGRILDFADIGDALDRPVKTYSSGMQLRLGFAVSVHVDPDVLLVDEAIAVGDLAFQDRCAERIRELRGLGCTVVLVSHELSLVQNLCERAIRLDAGALVDEGEPSDVVDRYLRAAHAEAADAMPDFPVAGLGVDLLAAEILDADRAPVRRTSAGRPCTVRLRLRAHAPVPAAHASIGLFDRRFGFFLLVSMLADGGAPDLTAGDHVVDCDLGNLPFRPGTYGLWVSIREETGTSHVFPWQPVLPFVVNPAPGTEPILMRGFESPLEVPHRWTVR
ncbi:MAG: ABC transporter ATP-binding protein [Solirubrobacteraceae bacterium]